MPDQILFSKLVNLMKWSLEYWAVGSQSAFGVKPSQKCAWSLHRKSTNMPQFGKALPLTAGKILATVSPD